MRLNFRIPTISVFAMFFGLILILALGPFIPHVAAQSCGNTVTITNEAASSYPGPHTSGNNGITIAQVLYCMGATSGTTFTATPQQVEGVRQWWEQAGLTESGGVYSGTYNPSGAQGYVEVNGGNPNGDNSVTFTITGTTTGQTPSLPEAVVTPNGSSVSTGTAHFDIWCDTNGIGQYTAQHDGSQQGATLFLTELTAALTAAGINYEGNSVITNQASQRTGNIGITLFEAFEQIGGEPWSVVIGFPGQIGGPGNGGVCEWWTEAGGIPLPNGAFLFIVPNLFGRDDHHPIQWVEVNGGNPDSNNAAVFIVLTSPDMIGELLIALDH